MSGADRHRRILVTGAARRIGRQIALDLATAGWSVAVHYNASEAEADEVRRQIIATGADAVLVRGDLSVPDTPQHIVEEAVAGLGGLEGLINNASVFEPDEVGSITGNSWSEHIDTNLRAPVFLSQAFAGQLPDGVEGNIINIIDQRVWKLTPRFFSYTASKAALWTVTRTLAQALAPSVRVNAIGPGPALPNIRMDDEDFARQTRATLLGRGTSPEEISAAVRFILDARAMTGQMIVLDGGQHLAWKTADVVNVNE